jgi:hypothetical protein
LLPAYRVVPIISKRRWIGLVHEIPVIQQQTLVQYSTQDHQHWILLQSVLFFSLFFSNGSGANFLHIRGAVPEPEYIVVVRTPHYRFR